MVTSKKDRKSFVFVFLMSIILVMIFYGWINFPPSEEFGEKIDQVGQVMLANQSVKNVNLNIEEIRINLDPLGKKTKVFIKGNLENVKENLKFS